MKIRLSQPDDLNPLMDIFREARRTIAALGIDQWQNGYPSEQVILEDIDCRRSYVVEIDGAVRGTFVLVDHEPTYSEIHEGQWLGTDYLAIHRVAVALSCRGGGISDAIIRFAEHHAKERGKDSLRIDTHRGNIPMRKMLGKQGLLYRGVIYLRDGAPRVAYEKNLG